MNALKAQHKSLADIMAARLDDVKSTNDPRVIRKLLEEVRNEMPSLTDAKLHY